MDESDPRRNDLHTFLQNQGPTMPDAEGALLTGWTIILEWVDTNSEHWLSRAWAPTTTPWTAKGMWHEALHGHWPDNDGYHTDEDDE